MRIVLFFCFTEAHWFCFSFIISLFDVFDVCCSACKCNGHASICNTNNGKCFCTTKGIKGDRCHLWVWDARPSLCPHLSTSALPFDHSLDFLMFYCPGLWVFDDLIINQYKTVLRSVSWQENNFQKQTVSWMLACVWPPWKNKKRLKMKIRFLSHSHSCWLSLLYPIKA